MATFKVRRDFRAMQPASFYENVDIDYGITTKSGSVSTYQGGLTAASTFTVTGSAIIGSTGTAVAGLLAGSGNIIVGATASTASVTSLLVANLSTAHKVFVNAACISGCLTLACAYCRVASYLTVNVVNHTSEDVTGAACAIYYLAVLDK